MVGRAEELSAALAGLRAGGVVLAGAAGVGKTRLAREVLAHSGRPATDRRVVVATASAQPIPLGAFADYATDFGADPLARIGEVIAAVVGPARRPPIVMVDDAHLLDPHSALVVAHLVRRELALVVLTVRSGESAPDAVAALWKQDSLARIDIQPLSRNETGVLLHAVLDGAVDTVSVERFWNFTRGNVLYLRQLVNDAVESGRLGRRKGLWVWNCAPEVSSTLAELVGANIGRQPPDVLDVLDALAVAEPLDLPVLKHVTGDAVIEQAEQAALIIVDHSTQPAQARLAHPLFGEVRRHEASTVRLRRLRGAILRSWPTRSNRDLDRVQMVRRALLLLESDNPADPRFATAAAAAALELLDPGTAERLTRYAIDHGGGTQARLMLMHALANSDRPGDAIAVNRQLQAEAQTPIEQAMLGAIRIGILSRVGPVDALAELNALAPVAHEARLTRVFNCVAATVYAFADDPVRAIRSATTGLDGDGPMPPEAEFSALFGLIEASRGLGKIDLIREHADRAYHLVRNSPDLTTVRFSLYLFHSDALRLAGFLADAATVADCVSSEPMEFAFARVCRGVICGLVADGHGDLPSARRFHAEAVAAADGVAEDVGWLRSNAFLSTALERAKAGDPTAARTAFTAWKPPQQNDQHRIFSLVCEAWLTAAEGLIDSALTILATARRTAESSTCPAHEVWCLQTVAQFGDPAGADRLTELSTVVQGPRVRAAAAHAVALRDRDGDGLMDAANAYEHFGDRIAAGDAAAQAAVLLRREGRRGAALSATEFARRLAAQTGADTPALRANNAPVALTDRQREIVLLAAHGLSNRQIADQLTMSTRTVEGHIFRASQRAGVNSRDELIGLLAHTQPADDPESRPGPTRP
jgi:DNA-binding CsgD family transcriptional regulator